MNMFSLFIIWSISSVLFFCAIYFMFSLSYKYWKKKGVPGPTPIFPTGNAGGLRFKKKQDGQMIADLYVKSKHLPYAGIFLCYRPLLMVNDLDLIKTILLKDFIHFTDHPLPFNKKYDRLSAHLFNTDGQQWRLLRNKLSPAFTSNKMRYMFETMAECGQNLRQYLETEAILESEIDVKEIMARFTTDVIVSCALGIESNSLKNADDEFRKIGKKSFTFGLKKMIVMMMNMMVPDLVKKLPITFNDSDVTQFFVKAIFEVIRYREKNGVVRNDIMQLLIRMMNNESIEDNEAESSSVNDAEINEVKLDKMEIAAQAFGFFIAGFETSSTASSFLLYELSANSDIQSKLRAEILDVLDKHDGKITYDSISKMTYLNQVVEESLRKYPPIPMLFRSCTKDYVIPNTNILIEKDTKLLISTLGIHHDPDIYPEPDRFDPDRFSAENKAARHHFSFLPFGEGPRICIGLRFAMMQIRIALASILSEYEVLDTETSRKGIKIDRKNFFYGPTDLYLRIKRIMN